MTRACVRKKRGDGCSAAAELLSASVTFHAERVCGEDRWASLRPSPSISVGTAPQKQRGKCRNIISAPFFHPTLLENRWSDQKLGAFAIFAVRSHHETEEGRNACREYRWEQLLTPSSRRSAARLDKAEGTSVWGSWYSSVFHSGLLITIAHFLYLIFLSPFWGWKLSVVASPLGAQRKKHTRAPEKSVESSATCFKSSRKDRTWIMASLYQRFTGKINTTNSFPQPPEASRLLGGQVADDENAAKPAQQHVDGRAPIQYRKKCVQDDEDVRRFCFFWPIYDCGEGVCSIKYFKSDNSQRKIKKKRGSVTLLLVALRKFLKDCCCPSAQGVFSFVTLSFAAWISDSAVNHQLVQAISS